MSKLVTIGELLIDFVSDSVGGLATVENFIKLPGGAPANVACCVSKLGGESAMITKLGEDPFGDFLINILKENKVDTQYIYRTNKANTGLAFVSLQTNGERDFTFYRNPSSDLFLNPDEVDETIFSPGDVLHFCSVDLVDYPVKKAHKKAIEICHRQGNIVSFDPNVRLALWSDHKAYCDVINEFIPSAHILKISDEELEFITGESEIDKAVLKLFVGHVKIVLLTQGPKGVTLYTKTEKISLQTKLVQAVDTTGAGDSFIGAVLYQLIQRNYNVETLEEHLGEFMDILEFANTVAGIVVTRKGAISALPSLEEVKASIHQKD